MRYNYKTGFNELFRKEMITAEQIFQLFLIGLLIYLIIKLFVLREQFIEFDSKDTEKLEETEREQLIRKYQSDGYQHNSTISRTYNYFG